jgi:putative ABC transport system substrate-binding protein
MRARKSLWKAAVFLLRGAMVVVALLSLALPAAAQDKVWRIGLLTAGNERRGDGTEASWRSGVLLSLDQNGYSVGKNLEFVTRYAAGNVDHLPDLAQEIATAGVDVVVAIGDAALRATLAATKETPIVMVVGADPVTGGFLTSIARPGGRVTGLALRAVDIDPKRLELLREAMPNARRFGYLRPPGPIPAHVTDLLANAARRLDLELTMRPVDRLDTSAYEATFSAMRDEGVAGVVVASTQILANDIRRFGPVARALGLPTICEWDFMARSGCTMAYGHDLDYAQRRVGAYVARILKGAAPADLPVEQPDAWKFTVNLGAAASVGLVVPPSVLARADEVIE